MRARLDGFSLLELAIFLLILTVLMSGLLVPLTAQVQAGKIKETERLLEEIKESLYGFALSQGRLPCPDDPAGGISGLEDAPCDSGVVQGFLPWNTLGVPAVDPWGRLFVYRVTGEFTNAVNPNTPAGCSVTELDLCDTGNITVDRDSRAAGNLTAPAARVPAVIVSVGPNGAGGTTLAGGPYPNPAAGTDENENLDNDGIFVSRSYFTNAPASCNDRNAAQSFCNFDDLVAWISTPLLFNRLVTAGILP